MTRLSTVLPFPDHHRSPLSVDPMKKRKAFSINRSRSIPKSVMTNKTSERNLAHSTLTAATMALTVNENDDDDMNELKHIEEEKERSKASGTSVRFSDDTALDSSWGWLENRNNPELELEPEVTKVEVKNETKAVQKSMKKQEQAVVKLGYVEPVLTLSAACLVVTKIEDECRRRGLRMAIAIYDQHGTMKLFHRMDGTASGSAKVAQAKGYTAASFQYSTKEMSESSMKLPANPYASVDGFLPLAGGVPIFTYERGFFHLGGVGVSGSSPKVDHEIATFGVESIEGLTSTRQRHMKSLKL